jgi:hypothetical protein
MGFLLFPGLSHPPSWEEYMAFFLWLLVLLARLLLRNYFRILAIHWVYMKDMTNCFFNLVSPAIRVSWLAIIIY